MGAPQSRMLGAVVQLVSTSAQVVYAEMGYAARGADNPGEATGLCIEENLLPRVTAGSYYKV